MNASVVDRLREFVLILLPPMGLELVEIQFREEGSGWVLRLFIDTVDRSANVTVDHCAAVSREVGDFLDVEDVIDYAFNLEVSSPGLERPLNGKDDYIRFHGKKARIKLRDVQGGQKVFVGDINAFENDKVELVLENGDIFQCTMDQIKKARLTL